MERTHRQPVFLEETMDSITIISPIIIIIITITAVALLLGGNSPHTACPTRYQTRHFFNNFTTEDITTKFEADCRQIPLHFSHKKRTPVQISLQYLHWC